MGAALHDGPRAAGGTADIASSGGTDAYEDAPFMVAVTLATGVVAGLPHIGTEMEAPSN